MDDVGIPTEQLTALDAFREMIGDPEGRREYAEAEDKKAVFDSRTTATEYEHLPEGTRRVLEELDYDGLDLLVRIDSAFVDGGLGYPLPSGKTCMVF